MSESVVVLRRWPGETDSRWTVLRASHTLSPRQGYRTSITAEPVEAP